ncbi:PIN domain-containing protein [Neolewinella antarctica]|uniref:Nucleic acid-binding protein n=1 Tax=Neolewinella antarctica TaxID=442734 RepID=A0ABX0XHF2_9BACT|nr:PIN domain-containing protein [Neolewinella antarctica]NJC28203.1 putative nucleic acid-binding protein [Neolewinella antarctica]
MRKVFVDTNVLIDVLGKRDGFVSSGEVFSLVEFGEIEIFVSTLTYANAHYVLSKSHNGAFATKALKEVSSIVSVVDLSKEIVSSSLNDAELPDFEDGLQIYSAVHVQADVIITRDASGFVTSPINVMTPAHFMASR